MISDAHPQTKSIFQRDVQLKESPHPPAPSPYLGEGEQDIFKVPRPIWATVYTHLGHELESSLERYAQTFAVL